jgi:plasmid stabilization system protein ParE
MKIIVSLRAKAEIEDKFEYGAARFGDAVAERTFSRVRHMIFQTIPAQPEAATYHKDRDLFERLIPHTLFVVFYGYNARAEAITVLALFGQSENRDSFEG